MWGRGSYSEGDIATSRKWDWTAAASAADWLHGVETLAGPVCSPVSTSAFQWLQASLPCDSAGARLDLPWVRSTGRISIGSQMVAKWDTIKSVSSWRVPDVSPSRPLRRRSDELSDGSAGEWEWEGGREKADACWGGRRTQGSARPGSQS